MSSTNTSNDISNHTSSFSQQASQSRSNYEKAHSSSTDSLPTSPPERYPQQHSSLHLPFHQENQSSPPRASKLRRRIRAIVIGICIFAAMSIATDWWAHAQFYTFRYPWIYQSTPNSNPNTTSWKTTSKLYRGLPACDPFSEPGSVVFNEEFHHDANWVPFGSSCPPSPDYLSALRSILNVPINATLEHRNEVIQHPTYQGHHYGGQAGEGREHLDIWGRPYPNLDFLRGKTILWLGDSAGTHETHLGKSTLAYSTLGTVRHPTPKTLQLNSLVSIVELSMDSFMDFPGVISLQSGLWDLAFFGRRNREANMTTEAPLTAVQLDWWQNRMRSVIRTLKVHWPNTPIWIRKTHRVGDQYWASHDWSPGLKHGMGPGFVNFFSDVRVHQLQQMQDEVARNEGLPIFDWGKIWEGYQKYQDKVHPQQIPGGVLMNQALLHHVWMESIGRQNWDPSLTTGLGPLPHPRP
ncbi:uncharacterized protein MELLADRAFT_96041 [Melampsora larici-populina 98AG31]|uniref:Uncharacterized protein n=2 Tax=Melampsora larici-populina (strain 98AG31 / pathotype 3-4-7) TaxID=747676 RepID=F4SAP4_MELLP|nr:uncharacterized protein MELLADRAFT_96041 [Melampsora larici-populina 98AG31]EGF98253.1 hypothetical protein MELLADRAFT_96041 [Melampsora larici-populina 98AG31]